MIALNQISKGKKMIKPTMHNCQMFKDIREDKFKLLVNSGSIESVLVVRRNLISGGPEFYIFAVCRKETYQVHTQKGEKRSFKTLGAVDNFLCKNSVGSYSVTETIK